MAIRKVLAVDDSPTDLANIKTIVTDAGFTVVTATNGREAVEKAKQEKPDLIFLDIHLADGSSFEIFKQIKITKPIIFITAYDAYAVQAFKQLSVDYLLKPLKKEELELSIKKYLSHFKTDPKSYEILTQTDKSDYYIIEVGQHIRTVDKKEVAYYFSASKITYLVTFHLLLT